MPQRKTRSRKKTVTPKQLAANRANAARSTGPRTPEGKARSSQNARKHKFSPTDFGVVRLEDFHHLAALVADLAAVYQPVNSQELFAIERMALAQQSMLRASRLEAGLLIDCLDAGLNRHSENPITPLGHEILQDIQITRAQNRNYGLARGFGDLVRHTPAWNTLLRYQAQAERHYRRAVEEFERLKSLRHELPNEPVSVPQPEEIKVDIFPKRNPYFIPLNLLPQAGPQEPAQPGPADPPPSGPAEPQ